MQVHITKDEDGRILSVRYSHTPEEMVAEMREKGEMLVVATGRCQQCPFLSNRLLTSAETSLMEEEYLRYQRFPECVKGTKIQWDRVRKQNDHPGMPDFIVCQWFYKRHCNENAYLFAIQKAGLMVQCDVTDLDMVPDEEITLFTYDLIGE